MSEFNLFAGVNENYEFPPEVIAALRASLNISNAGSAMTTAQRNEIATADLDSGFYIFNTQVQRFQMWRADVQEWHDGLDAPGTQMWWGGSEILAGWKKQDGTSLLRADFSALFNAIGTTYGGAETPNHFKLPDARGRVPVDSTTTYYLGRTGGDATVKLTPGQMPSHRHSGNTNDTSQTHGHETSSMSVAGGHTHSYWMTANDTYMSTGNGAVETYRGYRHATATDHQGDHSHSITVRDTTTTHKHAFYTDYSGGSEPHENMQPYLALNFLIKY